MKTPKVELQISIYGVKILDPKTKVSDVVWQVLLTRNATKDLPRGDGRDLLPKLMKSVNNERRGLCCFSGRAAQLSAPPDILLR